MPETASVLPTGIPTPGLQRRAQQKAKRIHSLRGVGVEGRPQVHRNHGRGLDLAHGQRGAAQQAQSKEQGPLTREESMGSSEALSTVNENSLPPAMTLRVFSFVRGQHPGKEGGWENP